MALGLCLCARPGGIYATRVAAGAALALAAVWAGCADDRHGSLVQEAVAVEPAEPPVEPAAIRARFLTDTTATVGRGSMQLHTATVPFYRARGFTAAWSDLAARDSILAALRSVEDEGIRPLHVGADRVDSLLAAGVAHDSARVDRDLLLTDGYFRLADALLGHRLVVRDVYRYDWHTITRKAPTAELLSEALSAPNPGTAVSRLLASLRPRDPEYHALRAALTRARRDDGQPIIESGDHLVPGDTSDITPILRRRLARTRDWRAVDPPDTLARIFDPALAAALRRYQARHGMEPSGELDAATRAALNTPGDRIAALLALNLERWRWLPDSLGERHVWVNIPAYELELRSRAGPRWRTERTMNAVVGQPGRWRTPVFSDTITQVVFNPTWTIPRSIQLESYGRVDPRGMVRQPGPGNPLGRVKFVFPNPYGIYLHDTNARRRLQWDFRALSHGCIRLEDPMGLAEDLLAGQGWDTTRVASRFDGPWVTEPVDLQRQIPVHLVYFTAQSGPNGSVYRLPDIYSWDARLARALGFTDEEMAAARTAALQRPAPEN